MNDDSLKREIEEALAVEPSPEFSTRVRQQIAEQRSKAPVRLPWRIWAPGLAMVGLLVAVFAFRPQQSPIAPVPVPLPLQESARTVAQVEAEAPPAPAPSPRPNATNKAPQATIRQSPAEPEVLIDPRETAALRRFLERIEDRRIDPATLEALFTAAERAQSAAIEPMPVAAMEPIVIPPLTAPAPEKEGGSL